MSDKSPKWVFWSTAESTANNIPSVTAIIETIVAVPLYWWLAIHSGAYLLLLASAIAAPFVLLRSDEAIKLGVIWFTRWASDVRTKLKGDGDDQKLTLFAAVVPIVASTIFVYLASKYFFVGVIGISVVGSAFVVGWLSLTVAVASAVLLRKLATGENALNAIAKLTLVLLVANTLTLIIADAPSEAVFGLLVGLSLGAISGAMAYMGSIIITLGGAIAVPVTAAAIWAENQQGTIIVITAVSVSMLLSAFLSPVFFGFTLGVLAAAILVRLAATLRHLACGIRNLPINFRRLTLCMSPLHEPELVPGLPTALTGFTLSETIQDLRLKLRSENIDEKIFAILFYAPVVMIWFFPSWLYRVTLKSTAWFWWPLAYLGAPVWLANHPHEFRRGTIGSLWAKTNILLSIITLISFVTTNLLLSPAILSSNPLITALGYAFLINWSAVLPWQFLSLSLAVLSVAIVYLLDDAVGQLRSGLASDGASLLLKRANYKLHWIERLVRLRFILFILFSILVAGQTTLYLISLRCSFPVSATIQNWAEFVYGERVLDKCVSSRASH